jgi:CDP-glucose 4,6-dehydratase
MLLAERMNSDKTIHGQAFNFSNEIQLTVLELVCRILKIMKSDFLPDVRGEATNEIRHQYLCAAKARKVLGWQPLFTLDEGLAKTVKWYKEFLGYP